MSIKVLITCIVISLAALVLPVSACDAESGQQTVATVETLIKNASSVDNHSIELVNNPQSKKTAHMHSLLKSNSDCCEDGCQCFMANCHHGSMSVCFSQSEMALNYVEQYAFIALAVPVSIYPPPYRPPIA